jgi:NCAIR mutase (PurE)-related protein
MVGNVGPTFMVGRPMTIFVTTYDSRGPFRATGESSNAVTNDERSTLARLLQSVRDGAVSIDEASAYLEGRARDDSLDFAELDHLRAERTGFSEVIFSEGKTASQVADIAVALAARAATVMATRATREHFDAVQRELPYAVYHADARIIALEREMQPRIGLACVVSAGTADRAVAAEAAVALDLMGNNVARVDDVGVAGLHRVLGHVGALRRANVVVAVAGMDGALPGVIAGLTDKPVIAVPTSVGYGASFGGLAALLTMLNACAGGVAVVNIDNGFGAACAASRINRNASLAAERRE